MSEQAAIPQEWRDATQEAGRALSVARAIEKKQYSDGNAPAGLLPALVIAVAIFRQNVPNDGRARNGQDADNEPA